MKLKGGFTTQDRRLDRVPQPDPRNTLFPIRTLVADLPFRSYTWRVETWLDQGQQGRCVGFAWAHELAARPVVEAVSDVYADVIYRIAQRTDEWPGEDYEGTSVIAGAKACQDLGHFLQYRWAFDLADLRRTLGYKGPAVLGINWYEDMFEPDADGFIHATGPLMGGHAILAFSVSERLQRITLHNSWGRDWGMDGNAYVSFDDMAALLAADGEACIPVERIDLG